MLRIARVVAAGYPHHTTQRGNYWQKVFYYIKKEPKGWKEFIEVPDNPDEMKEIKEKARAGRSLGPKLSLFSSIFLLRVRSFTL